jgi:deoxyribodipyrimidine photo-lyase
MTSILWFRKDLRLQDNPALLQLSQLSDDFIPVYILDDTLNPTEQLGVSQRWWLYNSLKSLDQNLQKYYKTPLRLFKGNPQEILEKIVKETKSTGLFWNRCYDSHSLHLDKKIKESFQKRIPVESFNGSLLLEPWKALKKDNTPFKVFKPFYNFYMSHLEIESPIDVPKNLRNGSKTLAGESIEKWGLTSINKDLERRWNPGEKGAHERLDEFIEGSINNYSYDRDFPNKNKTSCLSAHLTFGEISPHSIWRSLLDDSLLEREKEKFQQEIVWREFCYHTLFHTPSLKKDNFNKKFDDFPWSDDQLLFQLWKEGKTGYPLVDAGMRELKTTGWMHNRSRMVTASFLTKHLLIDWRKGAEWFLEILVDADLASNSFNWQWVAGSGTDASPYFRIFNPTLQAKKFDPEGGYIRKWVPELNKLSNTEIQCPWTVPEETLKKRGVVLGTTYPFPIINHEEGRKKALYFYQNL